MGLKKKNNKKTKKEERRVRKEKSGGKESLHFSDEVLEKSDVLAGCTKRSMVPKAWEVIVFYSCGAKGSILNASLQKEHRESGVIQ